MNQSQHQHAWFDRNHALRIGERSCTIVVSATTQHYRSRARSLPTLHDNVLEIGCASGKATMLLASRCKRLVSVDISDQTLNDLRKTFAGQPQVTIARIDGRNVAGLSELMPRPDLVFLDVGGSAPLEHVAFLIRVYLISFEPRCMVVKSKELAILCALISDCESLPDSATLKTSRIGRRLGVAFGDLDELSRNWLPENRLFAVRKLRQLSTPQAIARLKEIRQTDPSDRVRRAAGIEQAPAVRKSRIGSPEPPVRTADGDGT